MAVVPGDRIGAYEIRALIGAGGMGEVYRAHDTRLHRDVALKVLPDGFAADPDRLARFKREAQLLASLNHSNIAAIHGFEDTGRTHALVLELVEGPTLADRIAQGAIPMDEALPIARQIAEALEAAHEQGIVHRDLKPANIKVRPDGTVKVLDFGLAKAFEADVVGAGLSRPDTMSPTITSPVGTRLGVILGTAAYMSPEQARGKPVDKRADIWAFGCVLYEMLTGRRSFDGDDVSDVLARVIERPIDFTVLPAKTPASIARLIRRCVEKDAKLRMRDIGEARIELDPSVWKAEREIAVPTAPRYALMGAAILVIVALAGIALVGPQLTGTDASGSSPTIPVRASIDLPADAPLALAVDVPQIGVDSPVVAISPDSALLAYVAQTTAGRVLFVRDLTSGELRRLPGTEGAVHPFFSPDGQWVGFLTATQVKKIPVGGGTVVVLCDATLPMLAWWRHPDVIHFTESETAIVSRVSSGGGIPERLLSVAEFEHVVRFTDVLPDGETVLAVVGGDSISGDFSNIVQINLRRKDPRVVVQSGYAARYMSSGHLLFARGGELMAVRYDVTNGAVAGNAVSLASGVATSSVTGMLHAAASPTGVAAYAAGPDLARGKLAWIDRRGNVDYMAVPERVYGLLDLSPDGGRVAVHVADVRDYIWVWDEARGEGRRLASEVALGWPLWSPDGRRLATRTLGRRGDSLVHEVQPGGVIDSGRRVGPDNTSALVNGWAPQGDVLAFNSYPEIQIEFVGLTNPVKIPAIKNAYFPAFSPDGRLLAYTSTETGTIEIFVRTYPEGKIIGQVSTSGGMEPRWIASGELFYRNGNRWYSTHVSTTPEPRWDPPQLVFDTDFIDTPGFSYDVSADGQRLLVVKRPQPVPNSRINLIVNWPEILAEATSTQ